MPRALVPSSVLESQSCGTYEITAGNDADDGSWTLFLELVNLLPGTGEPLTLFVVGVMMKAARPGWVSKLGLMGCEAFFDWLPHYPAAFRTSRWKLKRLGAGAAECEVFEIMG